MICFLVTLCTFYSYLQMNPFINEKHPFPTLNIEGKRQLIILSSTADKFGSLTSLQNILLNIQGKPQIIFLSSRTDKFGSLTRLQNILSVARQTRGLFALTVNNLTCLYAEILELYKQKPSTVVYILNPSPNVKCGHPSERQ